jgi:hypothetical protein
LKSESEYASALTSPSWPGIALRRTASLPLAYPVNVEPGTAVVKGPYVAETIKVSVESDYVVVEL